MEDRYPRDRFFDIGHEVGVGTGPPRGGRGLLLYPSPLPCLRLHDWLPGGPAHGRDNRYVPQIRHGPGPGGPTPPAVHVLPRRSPHVRAPPQGGRRHKRRPIVDPLLPFGCDASLGLAGRSVGARHRRPHDRRLRHDRSLSHHPWVPSRLIARTRSPWHPLPLHAGAHRRSRKPLPRGGRWRGRRAHRTRPTGVLRLLEPG